LKERHVRKSPASSIVRTKGRRMERVEVFVRSVLEMIRQNPGISEEKLLDLYTRKKRAVVKKALLRVKENRLASIVTEGSGVNYFSLAFPRDRGTRGTTAHK